MKKQVWFVTFCVIPVSLQAAQTIDSVTRAEQQREEALLNWAEWLVLHAGLASDGEEARGQAKVVLSKLSPSLLLDLQARADVLTGQFLVWFELKDPEQLLGTTHFIEFYNQHLRRYSQGRVGWLKIKDIFSLLQEPRVVSATALSSTQVSPGTYKYWRQRLDQPTGLDCASVLRDR